MISSIVRLIYFAVLPSTEKIWQRLDQRDGLREFPMLLKLSCLTIA
jgi:hypothetical protein